MRTIIVATDYSDQAQNATQYAALLAQYSGSKLVLYNSYQLSIHASNGLVTPDTINILVQENQELLKQSAARLSKKYGVPVEYYTKYSPVEEGLAELVKQLKADLVIMGMRRHSLEYRLFGNTTTAVIRQSQFPVLVIPEGVEFKKPEKILFASDYQNFKGENPLELVKQLALKFNAEVQVFHVGKTNAADASSVTEEIGTHLKGIKHSYREVDEDDVVKGIVQGLEDFEADLLLMAHRKLGFWNSIFSKSKTREMALTVDIPLLILAG